MPHKTLQIVAGLLGLVAIAAFVMGIVNAPQRGHLPGERPNPQAVAGSTLEAVDATPLGDERIQGTPPPPELTPEEKARLEAQARAKAQADAAAQADAEKAAALAQPPILPVQPAPDHVGDLLQTAPPAPEEPPH